MGAILSPEEPHDCIAGSFGDSQFKTVFDGLYTFQTPGEYTLLTTPDITLQSRHVSFHGNGGTLLSAVAFDVSGQTSKLMKLLIQAHINIL